MPRKPWKIRGTVPKIAETVRRFLETGDPQEADLEMFRLQGSRDRLRAAWGEAREAILPTWIREHPCTRPWAWWEADDEAPRADTGTGWYFEPLPVPRRRLGGVGRTTVEVYPATVPVFHRGIPDFGEIDPDSPPMFESEAEFLRRHNLLSPAELRWLQKHPEALTPETLSFGDRDAE